MIHKTAIISANCQIHDDAIIGPYCIVDDNVSIDKGTELISNVHVSGNTKIGKNNKFFPFSSIGMIPQDKKFEGEDSQLIIGNDNIFREHVTINPGTRNGGMKTLIQNKCLFMVGSHVAHDCQISSNVILVNNATLGGHVNIEEGAIIGGNSAVHQFVNIGQFAMIGGMSGVGSNIIPYALYIGIRTNLRGLNLIGLKRQKISSIQINKINNIFKKIFSSNYTILENIENLKKEERNIDQIKEIINFITSNYKRGICKYIDD